MAGQQHLHSRWALTGVGGDRPARREPGAPLVLAVAGLRKSFGEARAVDDLSFSLAAGEFVGLLGPNGAGKTTTIKMLTGLMRPGAGSIRYFGIDFATPPARPSGRSASCTS